MRTEEFFYRQKQRPSIQNQQQRQAERLYGDPARQLQCQKRGLYRKKRRIQQNCRYSQRKWKQASDADRADKEDQHIAEKRGKRRASITCFSFRHPKQRASFTMNTVIVKDALKLPCKQI